jgi:hypothetical protein
MALTINIPNKLVMRRIVSGAKRPLFATRPYSSPDMFLCFDREIEDWMVDTFGEQCGARLEVKLESEELWTLADGTLGRFRLSIYRAYFPRDQDALVFKMMWL